MAQFTLRQLDYFIAVARHGGIAQAARAIHVSHPAVAQAIDKLEAITGLTLFERHHALGLSLTAQGRQFLAQVEQLVEHGQLVSRAAQAMAAGTAGEIRLGCFLTIAAFHLPAVIRVHGLTHPGIVIRPEELNLAQLASGLREDRLDAALTYDIGEDLKGLDLLRLAAIKPAVIVAADHPLAARGNLRLKDLEGEPYVMFDAAGSHAYFTRLLASAGISPRIGYSSTSLEGVRSAVGNGFGFSIVALRPANDVTYDGGRIRLLAIRDHIPPLDIVLATRTGERANPLLAQFAATARAHFKISMQ